MQDKYEILRELYDRNNPDLSGQFHNLLWQLMINESLGGETACFTDHWDNTIIIALASGGYVPTYVHFADDILNDPQHRESRKADIIRDLNEWVFGLTDKGMGDIVLKSLANNGGSQS